MRFRIASLLLSMLLLSSCEATVATRIRVSSETTADITTTITLTGEAAEVVAGDPTLDRQLTDLVDQAVQAKVERHRGNRVQSWSTTATYDELVAASGTIGVSGLRLTPTGDGAVSAEVDVVAPEDLIVAYANGVAGEVDSEVMAQTMAATTIIEVAVVFPGGVQSSSFTVAGSADTSTIEAVKDGNAVRVAQRADRFVPGTMTVVGDPTAPSGGPSRVAIGVGVAVLVVAAVLRRRRRRR